MAALVFKIFTLTIRTAAKPLAGRFQAWVLDHPTLRPAVVNLAQKMHKIEVGISRAAEGKVGKFFVGNMSDERALELASKVVSEGFVFGVGVTVIAWEYERQRKKDLDKKAKEDAFRQALDQKYIDEKTLLEEENAQQSTMIFAMVDRVDKLERALHELQKERERQRNTRWGMFSLQGR
ncbi:hypothetical protein WJX79_003259 [Trebouxia sp. C0005]|nr:MAG: hypothetical protein FRX49_01382 [Trebouxia sp. A1-2]